MKHLFSRHDFIESTLQILIRVALKPKVSWQNRKPHTLYLVLKSGVIEQRRTQRIASSLNLEPKEVNIALLAFGVNDRLSFVLNRIEESTRNLNCVLLISVQGSRKQFKHALDEVRKVNFSTKEGRTILLSKRRKRIGMIRHWNSARDLVERLNPNNEFFCWMSDHDYFENLSLIKAVSELKSRTHVAAVIPPVKWEDSNGHLMSVVPRQDFAENINSFKRNLGPYTPGNSIYGVFRTKVIREVGPLYRVLLPDRLWIFQVALFGPIVSFQGSADSSWVRYIATRVPSAEFEYQKKILFGTSLFSRMINSFISWQKLHSAILFSYTNFDKGIHSVTLEEALKEMSWEITQLEKKLFSQS